VTPIDFLNTAKKKVNGSLLYGRTYLRYCIRSEFMAWRKRREDKRREDKRREEKRRKEKRREEKRR